MRKIENDDEAEVVIDTLKQDQRIVVETKDGVHAIKMSDILYIEIQTRKKLIYTKDEFYISTKPVEYWMNQLNGKSFFRSHRNYIVNMKYVTDFDRESIALCHGEYRTYLARRRYKDFKDAYLQYLKDGREVLN